MADTGWLIGTSAATNGGTSKPWANAGNALALDSTRASVNVNIGGQDIDLLLVTFPGAGIPVGSTITQVEVRAVGYCATGLLGFMYVGRTDFSNIVGSGFPSMVGTSDADVSATTTYNVGTLSVADYNAGLVGMFGVDTSSGSVGAFNVNFVSYRVTYTPPSTAIGPQDGSTAASSGGTVPWTNPSNALTSNNAYASHLTNLTAGNNPYLDIKGFDFSAIPHDATIVGLTAGFEHKYQGGTTGNVRVNTAQFLKAGVAVGTNLAATGTNIPSSDTYVTVGGASSLNGAPWTPADIKSPDFGFRLRYIANGTSANRNVNVDHVRVSVTYTGGTAGPVTATFNVTDEDDTLAATAEVVPLSSGTSDVIALLHMNEGTFDLRPVELVNSAPSGLTFTNTGSDGLQGGRFWFGGEGPFGQALNTQGDAGAGVAIMCDQTIDVSKGLTHEGFFMDFDADGRILWELRENVAIDPAWWITVASLPQGGDTWTLQLDMKLPGYSQLLVQTSVFTANGTGNGNWVVTQWNDDGTIDIYVQGNRLLHTTETFDVALTAAKLAMFGSYRGTFAGGLYSKLISEFRFSKVQQYTGTSLTVPTARFPDPSPGTEPTPVTATLIVTDENDTMSASAQVVVSAAASWTDQDDVLAASAKALVAAALVLVDADDTFGATVTSGAVPIEATLVVTDEDDIFASTANVVVSANAALVDANDTMTATASVVVNAVANLVDADDTFAATTTTANTITFNVTDENDTFAATAAVIVTANAVLIDADDTFSATVSIPQAVQPHRGVGLYPSQVRSKRDTKRLEAFKRDQEDRRKAVEEAVYGKPPEEIEQAIAEEVQALESLLTPEFLAQYAEAQELASMFIAELERLEAELIAQQQARIEAEYREMEDVMLALARTRMGRNRFSLILRRQ